MYLCLSEFFSHVYIGQYLRQCKLTIMLVLMLATQGKKRYECFRLHVARSDVDVTGKKSHYSLKHKTYLFLKAPNKIIPSVVPVIKSVTKFFCAFVFVHALSRVCIPLVLSSCIVHIWEGVPCNFLSERSAVDRQSRDQFLASSARFVCGIPGM